MEINGAGAGTGDTKFWRFMIKTLDAEDWDRRVRISAGNMEGARVGSVAQVPPLGIKLALRETMRARAKAELKYLETRDKLRDLRTRRMAGLWLPFGLGAVIAGGVAIALRYGVGF